LPLSPSPTLAVGGHLKNSIAIAFGDKIFPSQHVGNLDSSETRRAFEYTIARLGSIYDFQPHRIACDLHPDYASTEFARKQNLPLVQVQHHYAHVLACMAEHQLKPPVLGVAWDGTGYGLDGTIWGGEFLWVTDTGFERVAHFRKWTLPGGDRAVKEPRRAALGMLYELFGEAAFSLTQSPTIRAFSPPELTLLASMLRRRVNTPRTSSVGRGFDAVASLLGLRQCLSFEGQGAMALEFAARESDTRSHYPFSIDRRYTCPSLDWEPMLRALMLDWRRDRPVSDIAAKFHNTLAEAIVTVARLLEDRGVDTAAIVLTGGCFQNQVLLEAAIEHLQRVNFRPVWHQQIPPNDGGIAVGQILAAALENNPKKC
ncbi:carbamoyltransferase HypF, partial [Geitlerinema sp. CS-897]|nr:carbamoyltransferase HypF [Geitlerinema sp. CS-897]